MLKKAVKYSTSGWQCNEVESEVHTLDATKSLPVHCSFFPSAAGAAVDE